MSDASGDDLTGSKYNLDNSFTSKSISDMRNQIYKKKQQESIMEEFNQSGAF